MKSINKFLVVMLCFVLFTTMAFALSACTEKELKITKIEVSGPSETTLGEFDYNDYTVKLIFDDGSTKDIKLNKDLLSASDRELLDTPGTHTITVQYNDVTCTFTVTIKGDGESQDKGIKSIAISGPNEIVAGDIDYSDFSLVITYEDDSTTAIELREEFILEEDRAKLNTVGSHSISITYNGTTTTWNITVKENESTGDNIFEGVTFEDATYTYDGREKSIEVNGVPDGATVKYNVSNSYTNAGTYPIEATISKEGYKTLVLTATLTINKATYDMSSVEFVDKTVVYNGKVQRIEISGSLPQGVTVSYENNENINVGTYEVVAKFTGDSNNYEAIADMTATLTIKEAKETEGLMFEKINNDTEYSVVGYEGEDSDIVILSTHEGLPVTTIGYMAFYGCSGLTSITIPESVTSIGNNAFYNCSGLTIYCEVSSKPDGWDSNWNYSNCPVVWDCNNNEIADDGYIYVIIDGLKYGLKNGEAYIAEQSRAISGEVVIKNSILYKGGEYVVTSIGWDAFSDCSGLTSIMIPDSVTSIGDYAFSGCSGLTSIIIPDSATSIGWSAFSGCSGLTIYCEVSSKPDGWDSNWNYSNCPVVWDCNNNEIADDGYIYVITDGIKYGLKDGEAYIAEQSRAISGNVVIKNSILYKGQEYVVTSIGNSAFSDCSGLTSITIPDSVTKIENRAFYNCSGLTSITIPDSVTSVGEDAFYDCTNLTSITIPFVGAKLDGTGDTNFDYIFGFVPKSLREVIITGGTSIGNWAFSYCSGLTSITIPNSVTSIGQWAFYGCSGLTSITIPDSVTSIGERAFEGCSGLTSIIIPESVTSIGDWTFAYCSGLTDVYYTGDIAGWCNIQFDDVASNPMYYADNLYIKGELVTDLVIPDSVTSIGNYTFYNCSGLTSITIPDSVTSIGNSAFSGCSGLTSITIPSSVTSIGSDAFYDCTSLISITIPFVGSNADGTGATNFEYIFGSPVGLHGYAPESLREVIITGGTSIGYRAFEFCSGLTSITIPDSVTSIGEWAFYNCSGLTSITIPDSVTSIGDSAFEDCSSLIIYCEVSSKPNAWNSSWNDSNCPVVWDCNNNEIADDGNIYLVIDGVLYSLRFGEAEVVRQFETIRSNIAIKDKILYKDQEYVVTSIGDSAFEGCSGLTSITIPDSVTSIGSYAFSGCSGLTSITIPDSVTSIGNSVFEGCSGLTSITIPDSVASIGSSVFYDCSGLTSITVAEGNRNYHSQDNCIIKTAPKTLIAGCKTSIIPDDGSVTSIGWYAFSGCSGLTSITIPDSVTSIGDGAFRSCSGLTSITIPDSVTKIENWAFSYCSGLTSITIPDSVTSIGSYAFYYCSRLTSVTIGNSVTSIGDSAFEGCSGLTIYCEVISKPDGWDSNWNYSNCPIVWDCNNNEIADDGYIYVIIDSIRYGLQDGEAYVAEQSKNISGELVIKDKVSYKAQEYIVTSITNYAFDYCSGLTSITIPDSVTSIGDDAFYNCSGLTSITIPSSVTSIGDDAFYNCSGLTSITIPSSVTSIGEWAFYGCSNLTNVTFENTQGWWYSSLSSATSGTSISSSYLADPATAATYLTSTYYHYYWKRS